MNVDNLSNLKVEPVDPPTAKDHEFNNANSNTFLHADEKMLGILINEDITTYLEYVNKKYREQKYKDNEYENKLQAIITKLESEKLKAEEHERRAEEAYWKKLDEERKNKYKNIMINDLWNSINKLEDTLNRFKF
jgi:sulfite reductase beta subunit-like hemoprotein